MSRAPGEAGVRAEDPRLGFPRKAVFGLGDYTVNTVLSSLSFYYVTYFLVQVAGLQIEYAGYVQLIARFVDAFTDPAMGRISDRTRWKAGRRRPWFLIGAIPFGVSFALLWWDAPLTTQAGKFVYYTSVYTALSLAMTSLSVPYLSLQPEMALGYDARTSLNVFRNVGSICGVLAAIAFLPLANGLGGGSEGFARVALVYGVMLSAPWFAVYRATWERPEFQHRESQMSFVEGLRIVARHRNYRQLMGLYLCGRISMDLVAAMLVLYFAYWIRRPDDLPLMILLLMLSSLASLPLWLRISRRTDKGRIFVVGSLWWIASQGVLLWAAPDWPRWTLLVFAPLAGIGYAVVDLMPWAMLGEVVDEDDLATGERREGLYFGAFTFLRKLAGSLAVFAASQLLAAVGYAQGDEQSEPTILAIRLLTTLGPALFLAVGVWFAWGYPLTRERHHQIAADLVARDRR